MVDRQPSGVPRPAARHEASAGLTPGGPPAARPAGAGGARWTTAGRPALHRLTRHRRGALITFAATAAIFAGLSATVAVLVGGGT